MIIVIYLKMRWLNLDRKVMDVKGHALSVKKRVHINTLYGQESAHILVYCSLAIMNHTVVSFQVPLSEL